MLNHANISFGFPESGGDGGIIKVFDKSHNNDLLVVWLESEDCSTHRQAVIAGQGFGLGVGPALVRGRLELERGYVSATSTETDDRVIGNREKPGDEWRVGSLVPIDRPPGLEKDVLGQVLTIVAITHPVVDVPVDAVKVEIVQSRERAGVTADRRLDQLCFGVGSTSLDLYAHAL